VNFWEQLKRRSVLKVGAAYLVVAWLIIQIAATVEEPLSLPEWFDTVVVLLLILGLPVALILAWAFELTPEGVMLTKNDDAQQEKSLTSGSGFNYFIIGALSLAIVFLLVKDYVFDSPDVPAETIAASEAAPVSSQERDAVIANSIAILPFENLSGDEANDEFAEGVYLEIFDELAKLDRVELIGRRTMKRYEDTLLSYQQIAAETNAQSVLELIVRFSENRVRINAELVRVDGSTESNVWRQVYEEEYTPSSLFGIQADIARNIAERVVGESSSEAESRLAGVLTENTSALSAYLRAVPYIDDGTVENGENCLAPISEAVSLDPGFKEAWYRKAVCHDIRGVVFPAMSQEERREERRLSLEAIERALAIDPAYMDALVYRSSALASAANWRAAGDAYRAALAAGGNSDDARYDVGFLFAIGHLAAAHEQSRAIFRRDPENANTVGMGYLMLLDEVLGNPEASDDTYRLGSELFEPWPGGDFTRLLVLMGRVREGQGDRATIARFFREQATVPMRRDLAARFDDRDAVVEYLTDAVRQDLNNQFRHVDIAVFAAYFDAPELSLEALKNTSSAFGINLAFAWMPLFHEVRQLDEFREYLREAGVVDVWNALGWPDLCEPLGGDEFRCD